MRDRCVNAGTPLDGLHFLQKGQAKIVMDVLAHVAQYPQLRLEELSGSLLAADDSSLIDESERIERVHSALAMLSGTGGGPQSATTAPGLGLSTVPTPGLGALAPETLGISSSPGPGALLPLIWLTSPVPLIRNPLHYSWDSKSPINNK